MTKMSVTMKRVLNTPKARANMRAGAKRRWSKAAERKRQAARMKKALGRPAARAAMRRGAKRRHNTRREANFGGHNDGQ